MNNLETPALVVDDGRVLARSTEVAEKFGRNHKSVLESIRRLDITPEWRRPNYRPTSYRTAQGKEMRAVEMTRDGFTILVMGFTGKAATAWKVRYIDAFNRMEALLRERPAPAAPAPGTVVVEQAEYIALLKDKIALLERVAQAAPTRRRVTPEEQAEMLRLHALGLGCARIGQRLGHHKSTVSSVLRRAREGAQ